MGFVCFFQLGSVRFLVKFHCYNIRHCPMEAVESVGDFIYCVSGICRKR